MKEETELFSITMRNFSIEPQNIRIAVEKRIENSYRHTGKGFRIAPDTTEIFKYSMDRARSQGRRIISASDMCFALVTDKCNLLENILQNPEGQIRVFRNIR